MGMRIGRGTYSVANEIPFDVRDGDRPSVGGRPMERGFTVVGRETGTLSQTKMAALEKDLVRVGDLYVEDDDALVPSGYYRVRGGYVKPQGSPYRRPWNLDLLDANRAPFVTRQAEDDRDAAAGSVTTDNSGDVDEDAYVSYTTTGSYADVLDPRTVSGAEKVNLPAGAWRLTLRAYPVTTATAQARWLLTDATGGALATGSDVTLAPAGAWREFDLGALTLPSANHRACWYEVEVQDTVNPGSTVRLDRVRITVA